MAGEDVLGPIHILTNGDMTTNLTSTAVELTTFDNIGFQFIFTGTPTGSFDIDISQDKVNWTTLPLSPAPVATGAADNVYVEINQTTCKWIRARYTTDASVGTLNILLIGKMV